MEDYEPVKVHVVNADDINRVQTEEHEPEHFSCRTYTVQTGSSPQVQENTQRYVRILELNPMRKDASILSYDNPVIICHSEAQANSAANTLTPGLPDPDGVILAAGQSMAVSGTGPLWAVATVATISRVGVIANIRGS